MNNTPLIQLALDFFDLPSALAATQRAHSQVDVIEIGTPLTKAAGMLAVQTIRAFCPDKLILADVKTPDVGGGEAKMCFDAGADWMTVLGAAPLETVKLALQEAQSRPGKEMFIELTGIRDILSRAQEWRSIGVDRMVYHRGWDEGNASRKWQQQDLDTIQALIDSGFKMSVAGGIDLDTLSFFKGLDISVFIIGRAIYAASEPEKAAEAFREKIHQL
jgi:3-dehydro-L-gulonate-6-phosphate decarboxylase